MEFKGIDIHNCKELVLNEQTGGYQISRVPMELADKLSANTFVDAGVELRFVPIDDEIRIVIRKTGKGASRVVIYYGSIQSGWQNLYKDIYDTPTEIVIPKAPNLDKLKKVSELNGYPYAPDVVRVVLQNAGYEIFDVKGRCVPPTKEQLPAKTYLAYGSSITHGSLAVVYPNTYVFHLGEYFKADTINLGFAGNARLEKEMADYTVIGKIKPMHGVGQPPVVGIDFSRVDLLKEASVPYSRLHDVGGYYGGGRYVDIPNLFRNFDADPTVPENYDFAFMDLLITELVNRGVEPFFRLGVTIENFRQIKAYHIYPPKDNLKWAKICEGVIRHYTEGWANGFHYDIKYWEIWNEPDSFEEPMLSEMWRGTKEQYFDLYYTASTYLKEKFPHLKIGGYASCGFYAINNADSSMANCSPRRMYFVEFFDAFLEFMKANPCPFDFFSWHSYAVIKDNIKFAAYARKKLDEAGFTQTEHTLNEWNSRVKKRGTLEHASVTAGMMLALQNTTLDSVCGIW